MLSKGLVAVLLLASTLVSVNCSLLPKRPCICEGDVYTAEGERIRSVHFIVTPEKSKETDYFFRTARDLRLKYGEKSPELKKYLATRPDLVGKME